MKLKLFTGAVLALVCIAVSGCGTAGFSLPGTAVAASGDQLGQTLKSFNDAVASHCGGNFNITWAPPLPPSGSANINCAAPAPTMVPLSQIQSLLAAPAAAPASIAPPS
jgi:hypothetical protein